MSAFGKKKTDENEESHSALEGRFPEQPPQGETPSEVGGSEEDDTQDLEYESDDNGGGEENETGHKYSKKKYSKGRAPPVMVGTSHQVTWDHTTKADSDSLVKQPLLIGLPAKNLSAQDPFNMRGHYLVKAHNNSEFAVGLVATGVNGEMVHHFTDDIGQKYTYPLMPDEKVDFTLVNGGKGFKLAGQTLDAHGAINLNMSKEELKSFAQKAGDGHVIVNLDFSSHTAEAKAAAKEAAKQNKKMPADSLNPLAKVVIANARGVLSKNPEIRKIVGDSLDPDNKVDKSIASQFQTFQVAPESFDATGLKFLAKVDEASLDNVLRAVNTKVKQAAKTSAQDYKIRVIRLNHKATADGKTFGDVEGEHGVGKRDADIAKTGVPKGVHFTLNHEIDHNGKPFQESVATSSKPSASNGVVKKSSTSSKK